MKKVGIFYGPTGGSTEKIAKKIQAKLGVEFADLHQIKDTKASDLDRYENIIFGCSTIGGETWNASKAKPDWDIFRSEFEKIDCKGKTFALFGLGDNISYPRSFVDNMGIVGKVLLSKKAKVVGQTSKDDYDFIDSEALIDNMFIGLPVNEDFDFDKTEERVEKWLLDIKQSFK